MGSSTSRYTGQYRQTNKVGRPELDEWHRQNAAATADRPPRWGPGVNPGTFGPTPPASRSVSQPVEGPPWQALAALAVFTAVLGLTIVAIRGLSSRSEPVVDVPAAAPATVAVVVREVVVTATPAPMPQPVPVGQVAPSFPTSGTRPVVVPPQPVYNPPAPSARPAPVRQPTYVEPSRPSSGSIYVMPGRGETVGYQGVRGGNAAVGSYQCAEQGVGVTEMDRATSAIKIDGATMYLSNGDGGPLTPPTYRRLTNCSPR